MLSVLSGFGELVLLEDREVPADGHELELSSQVLNVAPEWPIGPGIQKVPEAETWAVLRAKLR